LTWLLNLALEDSMSTNAISVELFRSSY